MDESQEEDDVMIIECEDEIDGGRKKKNLKDLSTPRREKKSSMPKTSRQNKTPCIGTPKKPAGRLRGKRSTVCTEITITLGMVRFTICGGSFRY